MSFVSMKCGLALSALVTVAAAAPVLAQGPAACGPRKMVVDQLGREYAEVPVNRGVTSEGALIELLASPSGSWTLLISLPNGQSCLAASGESWEQLDPQVARTDPAVFKLKR
jgi:hypothetical protein